MISSVPNPTDSSVVAIFDFDGTLTRRDSLLPFLRAIAGQRRFVIGLVCLSPMLVRYSLKLIPNWQAKETMLTYFLAGMPAARLQSFAQHFANQTLPQLLRPEAIERLCWHQQQGHRTLIVSASPEAYLRPFADLMKIDQVIGTRLEIEQGALTGRISGKNCYGPEKVARLSDWIDRSQNILYAYGDSRGDRELLAIAQFSYYRKFQD
ncbi:MAG: HAD-IB family hydrolase [Phormidesmis sp.]